MTVGNRRGMQISCAITFSVWCDWIASSFSSRHASLQAGRTRLSKDLQTSTTMAAVALEEEAQPWTPAKLIELEPATDSPSDQAPRGLPLALSNWLCRHLFYLGES